MTFPHNRAFQTIHFGEFLEELSSQIKRLRARWSGERFFRLYMVVKICPAMGLKGG